MNIQLSDHFTFKKLIRFTLPSIGMLVFESIYAVVDGFFVSNFVGKTSFAAVNFIIPVLMVFGAFGAMFGTGGSALVAKTLGEGKQRRAKQIFSMFVYGAIIAGVVLSLLAFVFVRPAVEFLGAEKEMLDDCAVYGRIVIVAIPALLLQYEFQSFFVAAEKPHLGLIVTVAAGVTNIVLDALFVAIFPFRIVGAAWSTAISEYVGGVIPLVYFSRHNDSLLRLTRTGFSGKVLLKGCGNGASEFLSTISMSVVSMLYNVQLMKYAGENGVAAYGTLMYVGMIFSSAFLGYSMGVAPVFGFHYGARNPVELRGLLKKSLVIIGGFSAIMFLSSELLAGPLSQLYVGYDKSLLSLTQRGFVLFSFSFLFSGFPVFGSAFFTALNNGLVSAAISFLRIGVFQILSVLILPLFLGIDGIWLSVATAEVGATAVAVLFWIGNRKRYL